MTSGAQNHKSLPFYCPAYCCLKLPALLHWGLLSTPLFTADLNTTGSMVACLPCLLCTVVSAQHVQSSSSNTDNLNNISWLCVVTNTSEYGQVTTANWSNYASAKIVHTCSTQQQRMQNSIKASLTVHSYDDLLVRHVATDCCY